MFKIESYITPIILSHVAKYVKNLRPQDSQVSLWGGEVAFQNLDLRLDVLEEELNLPFSFLSGHIHELIIHVPWTKIASEPITITINTIEFVLKLKSDTEYISTVHRDRRFKSAREEDIQAPPGYMSSLINKIANNISLKCNNIILKYIEEDIVVSMNVQVLSIDSADSDWNPAFIDISPTKVTIRKVININDLTICLDKRNSAGKIDVCQEPILYRCTMQLRLLRRYNLSTVRNASVTRIDIHTESMDLNISSQQFPMMMRLVILLLALKQGKMERRVVGASEADIHYDQDIGGQSFFSWAWDMLPSIFPDDNLNEDSQYDLGHILQFGAYVGRLKFTLKSQEIIADSVVNTTKKIKYNSILKLIMDGVFCDATKLGNTFFNLKSGITNFGIHPMGDCTCGQKQSFSSILTTPKYSDVTYLNDSLFDIHSVENKGNIRIYKNSLDAHFHQLTEEVMLNKSPAIAIDMVSQVEIPDDYARSSELGSDLEYSNLSEKSFNRLIIGPFTFKYCSSVMHLIDTIQDYINLYDYPPYFQEKPVPLLANLSPPSTDDYEALIHEVPLNTFQIVLIQPFIELHMWDHDKQMKCVRKKKHQSIIKENSTVLLQPYLSVVCDRIEANISTPLYPNRLIYTTCQLPNPPKKLFDKCYTTLNVQINEVTINLIHNDTINTNLITIPNFLLNVKKIIHPSLWMKKNVIHEEYDINLNELIITMNRPQQILLITILLSVINKNINYLINLNTVLLQDVGDLLKPLIDIHINEINLLIIKLKANYCISKKIKKIYGIVYIPEVVNNKNEEEKHQYQAVIISGPDKLPGITIEADELLSMTFQFPIKLESNMFPSIVSIKLNEFNINIDPILHDFINYNLNIINSYCDMSEVQSKSSTINETPVRTSSEILNKSKPRSGNAVCNIVQTPLEPVHSTSSEHDLVVTNLSNENDIIKSTSSDLYNIYILCRTMLVTIELRQCSIFVTNKSLNLLSPSSTILEVIENTPNLSIAIFKSPVITITSAIGCNVDTINQDKHFPIVLPDGMWSDGKEYFPWTLKMWGLTCYVLENEECFEFLPPIKCNITLAITYKDSKEDSALSMFWHIDTSPVVINICDKEILFLNECIETLLSLTKIGVHQLENPKLKNPVIEILQGSSSPETSTDLKEIFGLTPNNSSTKESSTVLDSDNQTTYFNETKTVEKEIILSMWLQWSFTKFSINFFTEQKNVKHKFVIDLEDILLTIDKQNVYTKIKNKIGSLNGQYYVMLDSNTWFKNYNFGISTHNDNGIVETVNDTFYDMTVTVAECNSVHTKWGTKETKKDVLNNNELIEIMINIQETDFRLETNILMLFINILNLLFAKKKTIDSTDNDKPIPNSYNNNKIISSSSIPLLYLDCKGLKIFLPVENQVSDCNVLFLMINRITITPNVENPLSRIPIRPDIYTKAAQLRILNTPGSKIEDRQYELLLRNISIGTASWKQLVDHLLHNTENKNHENPAFEWNNIPKKRMLDINSIFQNFNFSIVYAPCILYKNILICGHGLELNCLTDLMIELSTKQAYLINNLFDMINENNLIEVNDVDDINISVPNEKKKMKKLSKTSLHLQANKYLQYNEIIEFNETNRKKLLTSNNDNILLTDSGIESQSIGYGQQSSLTTDRPSSQKLSSKKSQTTTPPVIVPYDFWFIGGIFTIKFYHNSERRNSDDSNMQIPLLKAKFEQPNMLITQTIYDKKIQLSLFNMQIGFGATSSESFKKSSLYSDVFFESKNLNTNNSGIPTSLIKIKYIENVTKRLNDVDIEILRLLKFNFSDKSLEKLLAIYIIIFKDNSKHNENLHKSSPKANNIKPIINGNKIKLIKQKLFNVKKININIAQSSFECYQPKLYDLKIVYNNIKLNIELLERPEKIAFKFILNSFLIQNNKLIILHPCSIVVNGNIIQENWQTTPICLLNIVMDYIQIDFGALNIDNLLFIQKTFSNCINTYEKSLNSANKKLDVDDDNSSNNLNKNSDNLLQIITPKCSYKISKTSEEFYQDDLRAGAFQFIETNSEDSLPLPYQIQIIPKDRGIICWKYPQPRTLHQVQVFPVPFNTTHHMKVNCRLEYYNEIQEKFVLYCDFMLSENETNILELPNSKITASIWRVVMSQSMIRIDSQYFMDEISSGSSSSSASSSNTTDEESLINSEKIPIVKNTDDILNNSSTNANSDTIKCLLHPKVLVGCMRIDSYFNAKLIPKLQLNVNIKTLQINLINHINPNINYKPKIIKNYYSNNNDVITQQTFLIINMNSIKSYINFYRNMNINLNTELVINCDILDYSYLNLQQLFDEISIKCLIDYDSGNNAIDLNVITDNIRLRYGPSIVHTLTISELLWKQILSLNDNNNELILITRFVIVNQSNSLVQIGQIDTNEEIILDTNSYYLYTFRSNSAKQYITISIKNEDIWLKSNSININVEGVQYIKFNKTNRFIIIQIDKISTIQKRIYIRGQIEVFNMTIESFKIEHKYSESIKLLSKSKQTNTIEETTDDNNKADSANNKADKDNNKADNDKNKADNDNNKADNDNNKTDNTKNTNENKNETEEPDNTENILINEFILESKCNISLFNDNAADLIKNQCFRLRLLGSEKKGWSGEIPIKRASKGSSPWLVKVPTSTKQAFKSFWVRVIHESIKELQDNQKEQAPQRILIVIWPLFMLKSLLPINVTAYEVKDSEKIYSIFGRGDIKELQLSGTHETENELFFDLNLVTPRGDDKKNTLLSYKAIEKNNIFKMPKNISITNVIEELEKNETTMWPCSREEELRCYRETLFNNTINYTTPIYNISPSKYLSCSLMLNILPWALFINSTNYDIKLGHENISGTLDSCVIRANNIGMPFMIINSFKIELYICGSWYESLPIDLIENECKCTDDNSLEEHISLKDKSTVHLLFHSDMGLTKCILTTFMENGIKTFILSSFYIIINNTNYNLLAFMFTINVKEKRNIVKPSNSTEIGSYKLYKKTTNDVNKKGLITSTFFNLSSKLNKNPNYSNENKYNYFLVLYYENCEFSFPIYINKIKNRKCFSIFIDNKYIPISVTIIEYQEQYFITINDDNYPAIEIINLTKNFFYIAEADNLNSNKMSLAVKECPDYHFDWYQKINGKSNFFYTPPSIDQLFPNIENIDCGLLFAIITDPDFQFKKTIRWSLPVRLNETKDLFLTIPHYGDVKLSINITQKTTTIVLNYISENLEFCVRDIRSRLSHPDNDVTLADDENVAINNKFNITNDSISHDLNDNTNETRNSNKLTMNIFIKQISISLFNDDCEKLTHKIGVLTVFLDNLCISYNDCNNLFEFGSTNIQIDNQLYSTGKYDFPVVLCGQNENQLKNNFGSHTSIMTTDSNLNNIIILDNLKKLSNKKLQQLFFTNAKTLIYIKINFVRSNYSNNLLLDELYCKIRPISAYIEDTYVNMLLDLFVECLPINLLHNYDNYINYHYNNIMREILNKNICIVPKFVIDETNNLNNLFHIRSIRIEPLSVLLSVHTCMRLYIALDHSPLDFDAFERLNVKSLPMKFGYAIGMHYLSGAIFGAGWVVGSLEILGSPSGLARSLSTGLCDFVSLPVQGLLTGPWDFLVGITYGSASLIRNITAGTVNSVTKLATSVARNLDRLTLDEEHLQRTDALRRCRPQGVTQGFSQGLTGFGISMLGAVGGLARHTLEAKTPVQVMTGVGKGIVGAFAKPISGAADLVALTGQGMLHTVGYNILPTPRFSNCESVRSNNPEICKILWKMLPRVLSNDPILFAANATMNTFNGFKAISICLTVSIVTIIGLDTDEIIEIIPIEQITPNIDECDSSLIILKIVSTEPQDSNGIDVSNYSITRIQQFIRDSNDLLPKVSIRGASFGETVKDKSLHDNAEDEEGNYEIRKLKFYINENIGNHFIKYVKLLKNN